MTGSTSRGRHALAAAALGAAVAGLGACGGAPPAAGPTAERGPTPVSSSPAPTATAEAPATPTPNLPDGLPVAATKRTPEGAEAFVRHYLDQINVAWTTPQAGLLPPLSGPDCKSCAAYEKTAQRLVDGQQHYESDPVTLTSISRSDQGGGVEDAVALRADVTQNRVDVLDSHGGVVRTDRRMLHTVRFTVRFEQYGWRAIDIQAIK